MSTNTNFVGGGDIEAGRFNGHVDDIEINILPIEAEKMEDGVNNSVNVVDTEEWASSLESMLEDIPRYKCSPGHPGRISRIPENLREVDIKSYEPCYLSIGPYHHGKPNLQGMEKSKWITLKCLLEKKPELVLKDLLMEMKSVEPAARGFYTGVEMDSEQFVQMLLLDSMYLVIVFCGVTNAQDTNSLTNIGNLSVIVNEDMGDGEDKQLMTKADQFNDETTGENSMTGPRWFWTLLVHDLFLLENQLPFFVLQKMHDLICGGSETQLIVAIKSMVQDLLADYVKLYSDLVISPTMEVHHLLHLCHLFFRPTFQQDFTTSQLPESSQIFRLGSAVQLYEAGISFEATSNSAPHGLLDITFGNSGNMSMPCLHVDDNTNSLLRNLIALEQMKYPSLGLNVSGYAVLLLHLITVPADVKLLRSKGIIQHHLASDKEMMCLINRLSVGLAFDYVDDEYSLKPIFHELKRYSDSRVPGWRVWLKHKYFNNPWTTVSLMAASLLLLLSALETYYTVYSYYHPLI